MAGTFSLYTDKKVLDHVLGKTSFTMPTTYLGLFTADPGKAGALTNECADANNYARVTLSGKFNAAGGTTLGQTANGPAATDITFGAPSGSWGTITHWAILDSGTHGAGNILASGALTTPQAITTGNTVTFVGGTITGGALAFTLD